MFNFLKYLFLVSVRNNYNVTSGKFDYYENESTNFKILDSLFLAIEVLL